MWAVWFGVGVIVGAIASKIVLSIISCRRVLRIDCTSNPEKDIYRFDAGDLDELSRKKYMVLKIDNNAILQDDSQE